MKQYCKDCGHRCHCQGVGYNADKKSCDVCECKFCVCKQKSYTLTEEQTMIKWIKKQWQKFIDWVFDGFYK